MSIARAAGVDGASTVLYTALYIVIYSAAIHYIAIYSAAIHYIVIYSAAIHFNISAGLNLAQETVLRHIVLYSTVPHNTLQFYATLYCTVLRHTVLYSAAPYSTV